MPAVDPAARFAALVACVSGDPDVQPPDSPGGRRFGSELREWVALTTGEPAGDGELLGEALDLARSRAQSG